MNSNLYFSFGLANLKQALAARAPSWKPDQKVIVVVTHSGTIRAILSHLLGIDPDISIGIEISHLSFTSIEVIDNKQNKNRGGRFRVLKVNQQF